MKHSFTTIPGVLWVVTGIVLVFYRLNKKRYNEIVEEINVRKSGFSRQALDLSTDGDAS